MKYIKPVVKFCAWVVAMVIIIVFITGIFTTPRLDRDWNKDQSVMPHADIDGDQIKISNIRNISYSSTSTYEVAYYDKTFNLNELERVWFMVEPFKDSDIGAAHTMVSFEFANDQFVAISVEIRKEKGESFSAVKGLFNQYELMYVIADEKDVIKLRSNYRKDNVYLYPIKTEKEKAKELFLSMITRANDLGENPQFYNTIANNCTTNIAKHINSVTSSRVPYYDIRYLLPAFADSLAYELGLIDTDLSFEQAQEKYHINERAMQYADDPSFSRKIRE
jgi:hypothetical protein